MNGDTPVPWKGAGDVGTPMTEEDQSNNDIGNLHAVYMTWHDIVQLVIE